MLTGLAAVAGRERVRIGELAWRGGSSTGQGFYVSIPVRDSSRVLQTADQRLGDPSAGNFGDCPPFAAQYRRRGDPDRNRETIIDGDETTAPVAASSCWLLLVIGGFVVFTTT